MDAPAAEPSTRNVHVVGHDDAVLAGFWQHGTVHWDAFYRYLRIFVVPPAGWELFAYDPARRTVGARCPPVEVAVPPGHYVLLSTAGAAMPVTLSPTRARARVPSRASTPGGSEPAYVARARARDGACLVTGLRTQTFARLRVVHIFPRAHEDEWVRRGFADLVADAAGDDGDGAADGASAIDALPNLLTLRTDLRDAWVSYDFGIDPANDYRLTPLTRDLADIARLRLRLRAPLDPARQRRPHAALLADHLAQGVHRHMKGAGAGADADAWTDEDACELLGGGAAGLGSARIWGTEAGRAHFAAALADRLYGVRGRREGAETEAEAEAEAGTGG